MELVGLVGLVVVETEWFEALRLRYGIGKPIDRTTGGGDRCKVLKTQEACEAFTSSSIPDHLKFS